MSSLINTTVKSFQATAYHNGKFVQVTDADLRGRWSVVFFYPADFTFVCPTELGDLADHYAEFRKLGVEIYSESTDTHFTHKAWHDTSETIRQIRYPMVGDPTGTLARNFGVMIEERLLLLRLTNRRCDTASSVLDPNRPTTCRGFSFFDAPVHLFDFVRSLSGASPTVHGL